MDFVSRNGDSVVFRTCAEEAGKVVFQIGTADAVLALKAAEAVFVVAEFICPAEGESEWSDVLLVLYASGSCDLKSTRRSCRGH